MIRKYNISSVRRYSLEEVRRYSFIPVNRVIGDIVSFAQTFHVSIESMLKDSDECLKISVRGKRKDITYFIVSFLSTHGEHFDIKRSYI